MAKIYQHRIYELSFKHLVAILYDEWTVQKRPTNNQSLKSIMVMCIMDIQIADLSVGPKNPKNVIMKV